APRQCFITGAVRSSAAARFSMPGPPYCRVLPRLPYSPFECGLFRTLRKYPSSPPICAGKGSGGFNDCPVRLCFAVPSGGRESGACRSRIWAGCGMAGWVAAKWARRLAVGTIACAGWQLVPWPVWADTLEGALVQAYQNNPSLNSQRAAVRATDEGVPQALAGYRPKVSINGSIGQQYWDTTTRSATIAATYSQLSATMTPSNVGITATQTLYNGFQTSNRTRQAESQVQAARESLRVTEQAVLLNAATAYMNLLRDSAIR